VEKEIDINGYRVKVVDDSTYGFAFWDKFSNGSYEPGTQKFLRENLKIDSVFFDIGAAIGSMSLLGATCGSKVVSIEAIPEIFRTLESNVGKNEYLASQIVTLNCAIGKNPGHIQLSQESIPGVLSAITLTEKSVGETVQVVRLSDILTQYCSKVTACVLKMDIEGAEWDVLSDDTLLQLLKSHKSLLYLSIHPGFMRPPLRLPKVFRLPQRIFRMMRNVTDAVQLFLKLKKQGNIFLGSRRMKSTFLFCIAVLSREYDFVIDFGPQK